jgi:molecular chaperone GrpE
MSKKNKERDSSEHNGQDPVEETAMDAQAENSSENELAELKDKYLRLFAEFDNYKKRTARERLDLIRTAAEDLVTKLLPVLDDFDRAKKNADDPSSSEAFSEGVSLVYQKLHHVLESKGLQPMDVTEKEFDPELHEAITKIPAPDATLKGKIIDHVEKGYYLNDKIIRHAKVIIGE